MKESWRQINCTKIQMKAPESEDTAPRERKAWKLPDYIFSVFVYVTLILSIITTIVIIQRLYIGEKSAVLVHLSKNELKDVVKSILSDDFHDFFAEKRESDYTGKVQLLDESSNVLWSEDLGANDLMDFKDFSPLNFESIRTYEGNEYTDSVETSTESPAVSVRRGRSVDERYQYLLTRYVNCARFKPLSRGRYLASPNLEALHSCYKRGARLDELASGQDARPRDSLRYDLENLYLRCEETFTQKLHQLTPELAADYRRCRRAGTVEPSGADFVERRFAQSLAEHDRASQTTEISIPENLQSSTTSKPRWDIRAFVNCAHLESQEPEEDSEEDSLEGGASKAALALCDMHGVTAEEIEWGVTWNPLNDRDEFDEEALYIPCEKTFEAGLNWITKELIEDYRRCRSLDLITARTRRIIEDTFYEHINGGLEESSVKPTTMDYGVPATESSAATTTTTTTTPATETTMSYTEAPATPGGHAFANCRRINNQLRVCIKVIAVYPGATV